MLTGHHVHNLAIFTDLHELAMLQAYVEAKMEEQATFSLFTRRLPKRRNYLLACGLDDVLSYLEIVRFDEASLGYLASLGRFKDSFLAWLRDFRFTGDVHAIPEGTPVFANEPILEITAPIAEAQLAETFVVNQIHLQTTLASKAARVWLPPRATALSSISAPDASTGRTPPSKRRERFTSRALPQPRIVLAGKIYGLPVTGTMAHSFVQAWDDEKDALRSFVRLYPDTVLLVDTYDTPRGVGRVCELARELGDQFKVRAVRLDSGDLAELAWRTREILDEAGLGRVEIFASSGLDEDAIDDLVTRGAPITGFGVGTKMGVSEDAPSLDIAYKLCAYAGKGRVKLSTGKPILPGRKQVFRIEENGHAVRDVIARADEHPDGRPLLHPVMAGGRRTARGAADLDGARIRAREELGRLPDRIQFLALADPPYPVFVSDRLRAYEHEVSKAAG